MSTEDIDFNSLEMAQMFTRLPARPPITETYENEHPQKKGRWWKSQREHMVGWFRSQSTRGSGQYSRNQANYSGKRAYNRLLSDSALLWINEALGADPAKVQAAADAARQEPDHRRRCKAIRDILPWKELVPLIEAKGLRAM
ncbi:hypothetical protein I6E29_08625 [Arcanobacterium haemolyticum]|nr:hypothetical protein [Arcanobacterium haemolyticum]